MTIQTPRPADIPKIACVAEGTSVFNRDELRVVREMLDVYFHPGPDDDYEFIISRTTRSSSRLKTPVPSATHAILGISAGRGV